MPDVRYEIRVTGQLGALMAAAVGGAQVRHVHAATRLMVTSETKLPLALLVEQCRDLGLEVEHIRRHRHEPSLPEQVRDAATEAARLR
jgi:hypothetical protein